MPSDEDEDEDGDVDEDEDVDEDVDGDEDGDAHNNEGVSMTKTNSKRNVAVEIALADGSQSLVIGALVLRTKEAIVLVDVAFVRDTGRRSEFFAGRYDTNVEVEPYPDGMRVECPAKGAVVYDWPHPLLRAVK